MLLPLLPAVLLASFASAQQGESKVKPANRCADKNFDDLSGAVSAQEIEDIFNLLLNSADENGVSYDANLDNQKSYGKPTRRPTMSFNRDGVQALREMGTPAAAVAAHTGQNGSSSSRIVIHTTAVRQIAGARRGSAAFVLAHEFKHLINKDGENLEVHNLKHYDQWCAKYPMICASKDWEKVYAPLGDAARNDYLRPLETAADVQAAAWISKLVDPKTGKPFGSEAAPRAIEDMGCWMEAMRAKGILEAREGAESQHESVAERLKAVRGKSGP